MSELAVSIQHHTRRAYRVAVSTLFFLQGLCFASWASRIPTIQQSMQLSESALGLVLFALPAGSIFGLPLSGWLVTRFGSRSVVINAIVLYVILLAGIGLAQNITQLVMVLVFFGATGNIANIAMNTQAVGVELKYGRNIMASFHGLWSLAGFSAAGIGSYMMGRNIVPFTHFSTIAGAILLALAAIFQYLLPNEEKKPVAQKLFVKPDRSLITLGVLAFCCMMVEGTMFDWSGIYFKKVVGAEKGWIGAGYTAFMCTMAAGRFIGDWIATRAGISRTIQVSGLLIAGGLSIALIFPALVTAITGFLLVGLGVSSVVPLVYSAAGRSTTLSPGMALAAVSSIGFLGFLIGPPLIGIIAGASNLSVSFTVVAIIGFCVTIMGSRLGGMRGKK